MASAAFTPAFEAEFLSSEVSRDPRIAALIGWCRRVAEWGAAPASAYHGNAGVRTEAGFLISGTQTDKSAMRPEQFVEVVGIERTPCCLRLRCRGIAFPSSDALLHAEIYRWRPDAQVILHGHNAGMPAAAPRLGWPSTAREYPAGSPALAQALEPLVRRHDFLIVARHGFLALGASLDAAGRLAEAWHHRAANSA